MVELVGARSDLRRVGSRWTGLCPFHDERTPSFSGNAGCKLYNCFGFRARIMFPQADPRGKVLGFGARSMRDDQGPKYVNTSENELYHKGRQLFGIDHARGPAARAGRIVAVEGYTDVLALHQAGVTETVAIMGTALTQEQMAELGRAAGTVYLALDADRAGQD